MSDFLIYTVTDDEGVSRIDKYIGNHSLTLTRSSLERLFDDNLITVNEKAVNKNYKVRPGDKITVTVPEPTPLKTEAEDIPLDIVYEDDDLLVVNKPKGMVVHPAPGNQTGTLVNALLYHCKDSLSGINGVIRPGIVHRIDKDTSGLLIVAKNDKAHLNLAQQIKEHSFYRAYEAVVYGNIKEDSGIVDKPIGRNPKDRKKMAITDKNSRNAITNYEVIKRYKNFTHIKCILKTGRTHQIRVHMASIGHPLAGDEVYGPKKVIKGLNGQCLHAKEIGFVHPISGKYLEFTSELPDTFKKFLTKLENENRLD